MVGPKKDRIDGNLLGTPDCGGKRAEDGHVEDTSYGIQSVA